MNSKPYPFNLDSVIENLFQYQLMSKANSSKVNGKALLQLYLKSSPTPWPTMHKSKLFKHYLLLTTTDDEPIFPVMFLFPNSKFLSFTGHQPQQSFQETERKQLDSTEQKKYIHEITKIAAQDNNKSTQKGEMLKNDHSKQKDRRERRLDN